MLFSKYKQTAKLLGLGASLALMSATSIAQESGPFFGKQAAGKWIIGAKAVNIGPNDSEISDSRGVGIVLGYEFAKTVSTGKASFEIEYIDGDEEDVNTRLFGSYQVTQLNAFFNYRSPGNLFYKLKGGLSYTEIDTRSGNFVNSAFEETSLAAGIGIGYKFNEYGMIELEYTSDFSDADLDIISLNGLLTF